MRAIVLGSAAGGGFPQWNCGCRGCQAARAGEPGWTPRTQDSVALTSDGERFVLLNASPDVLEQIRRTPALSPRGPRRSPIAAIVMTNGDLDHVLGLFSLRESTPLAVYATEEVWRGLEASVFLETFSRFQGQLVRRRLVPHEEIEIADASGALLGLRLLPLPLPGKPPIHLGGLAVPMAPGDNLGLALRDARSGRTLTYAPAAARLEGAELEGDVLLFDGTFFREDELPLQGLGPSLARDMAHLPIDGGSLPWLARLSGRKIYTHINNSNPILGPTEARARVLGAGVEIAFDGMEIEP